MINIENEGLSLGLNKRARKNNGRGTKLGSLIRKNVRLKNVNLKNAVKAGSLASNFIPGGAVATKGVKVLGKLGKVGRLGKKAIALTKTGIGQVVMQKAKAGIALSRQEQKVATEIVVANETDPTTPNVLTPQEFNTIPTQEVQVDAPVFKPTVSAEERTQEQEQERESPSPKPLQTEAKNNIMLYVGGGLLLLGVVYVVTKKSK